MGFLRPCLSGSEILNATERVLLELYEEDLARSTSPGFDDVLGEPLLPDTNDDGIGERVRPSRQVVVKGRVEVRMNEEQAQDHTGNAPKSSIVLTMFETNLKRLGLLVDGVLEIRPNDRLLSVSNRRNVIRYDFTRGSRVGLSCYRVDPGGTGEGIFTAYFDLDRLVAE